MALQDTCCPPYPDDWVCAKLDQLLAQYKHSPKLKGFIELGLTQLDELRCLLIAQCNSSLDCTAATGAELDAIGLMVGFPRCHCNAICDPCKPLGVDDYCLEDDLYCHFIQAQIITNQGGCSVAHMEEAIKALWGNDDASVVHSGHGSVGVWPGRALSDLEKRLYGLYRKVLPLCLGVHLVIYDTAEDIPSWCCDNTWCEVTPTCVLQDCTRLNPQNNIGPICPDDMFFEGIAGVADTFNISGFAFSQQIEVYPDFPVTLSFSDTPSWIDITDNGNVELTVNFTPPANFENTSFTVTAMICSDTDAAAMCEMKVHIIHPNDPPVAPPDETIGCGNSGGDGSGGGNVTALTGIAFTCNSAPDQNDCTGIFGFGGADNVACDGQVTDIVGTEVLSGSGGTVLDSSVSINTTGGASVSAYEIAGVMLSGTGPWSVNAASLTQAEFDAIYAEIQLSSFTLNVTCA